MTKKIKEGYVVAKDRAKLSVGDVIKMTCEFNDVTQAELARRSGLQPSNLSEIVNGRRIIGRVVAEKIAKALNVSPSFILFAGNAPREGSDVGFSSSLEKDRTILLLHALRMLKDNENEKVGQQRTAMRNAIQYITQVLKPVPETAFMPLNVITHSKNRAKRAPTKHRR